MDLTEHRSYVDILSGQVTIQNESHWIAKLKNKSRTRKTNMNTKHHIKIYFLNAKLQKFMF